jgi:DNA-binding MarR family transcriptional regulator
MPESQLSPLETAHELRILEQLESNPDLTQASLAARLGVAVGTVNWYLKRLVAKGYVKAKRLDRRRLRYVVTPQGISLRSRLTVAYLRQSMRLYRETRAQARRLMEQIRGAGLATVHIRGEGEIAEICRLTGLEQGIAVLDEAEAGRQPVIVVRGTRLELTQFDPPEKTDANSRQRDTH